MLTTDLLVQDEALKGLTEEQLTAITTLSERDENSVIGKRIGEVYTKLDSHIKEVTGIDRDGDEKTYNYLTRAMGAYKGLANQATEYKEKVTELTTEMESLKKSISEGNTDKELVKRFNTVTAELDQVKLSYSELHDKYTGQKTEHQKEIFNLRLNSEIGKAVNGFSFKQTVPDAVKNVLLEQALNKVKSMNPEFVVADGKETLVFKDQNGVPLANPSNRLAYYTASELLEKELKELDILDDGRNSRGTGTTGGSGSGVGAGGTTVVDISGAKIQSEAYEIISNALIEKGLQNGSKEFSEEIGILWKELEVNKLPLRKS